MKTQTPTSQGAAILRHLKRGRKLTAIQALKDFHCFRLAARISDLREDGWDIRTKMIETEGGSRIAEYRMP